MTDDDIVGIRMTTEGDIKAFARAIEKKVKGIRMVKIGDRLVNINSINYIIDRHVFFNNGTSWVMTEPEIQILLAALFDEPRVPDLDEVRQSAKVLSDVVDNEAVKQLNTAKKPAVKKTKK